MVDFADQNDSTSTPLRTSQQPLATVAVVTYNSERHVAEAIDSVLSQSYTNLELIICDDASSDSTWDIVSSFTDNRVRRMRNEKNIGEYQNRNQALREANGEYLIFIDGDDLLYPHGLEFMVRSLAEFPESAMALARPWSEQIVYPYQMSPRELFLAEFLGRGALAINFAHVLFRTSCLRAAGGLSLAYRQGDAWIQFRLALEHTAVLISDGLAWWRRTPGQASETVLRNHAGWVESLAFRTDFLEDPRCPLTPQEKEIAIANEYGGFLRMVLRYMLKGKVLHAISLLRAARLNLSHLAYAVERRRSVWPVGITADNPLSSGINRNPFCHHGNT